MLILKQRNMTVLLLVAVMLVGCEKRNPYAVGCGPEPEPRLVRLAESGDVRAQNALGHYYNFREPARDPKEAAKWFSRAALNGHAWSTRLLSGMSNETNETWEGHSRIFWTMLAAKQGDAGARAKLSAQYVFGVWMPTNAQLSAAWGQAIYDGNFQDRVGENLIKHLSHFTKAEHEKVNTLCTLIGEATKQKLWKKELEQGMGDTNLMDFAWTYEYLSKPGVLLPGTSLQTESKKTLVDELSPDKISYVLIGDGKDYTDLIKKHFWKKEIFASGFNTLHCVTNREAIAMLITELKTNKVAHTYGEISSTRQTELFVSKNGHVVAHVLQSEGHPCVTVKKGEVIKKDGYFYVVGGEEQEYGEFVVCRSGAYSKMISELLRDKSK
jgi:hypothetical protein